MEKQGLMYYLSQVPDPRRAEGKRYSLEFILVIVLMSMMSGYDGYRGTGDFITKNEKDLRLHLKWRWRSLPTFYAIRDILMALDFGAFSRLFHEWMLSQDIIKKGE